MSKDKEKESSDKMKLQFQEGGSQRRSARETQAPT